MCVKVEGSDPPEETVGSGGGEEEDEGPPGAVVDGVEDAVVSEPGGK